jgi:hypothetical protein
VPGKEGSNVRHELSPPHFEQLSAGEVAQLGRALKKHVRTQAPGLGNSGSCDCRGLFRVLALPY